jgi:apolipoprotein N-acyltransferase
MIFELWGFYIFNKKEEPFKEIKIAIYQPHIPLVYSSSQELLLAERIYDSLSFYSKGAVLSIFPESALPGFLRRDTFVLRVVKNFVNKTRSFLILGNADYRRKNKRIRIYNTAFLIDKNGNIVDHYNKVHLTPFGEALPYDEKFPFLRKFQFGQGNYSRGEEIRPFDLPFGKVQVLICFESIFPYISREGVGKGANIIVNITSDGWFGKSLGPKVHRDLAIFRAIETRRYILRSARSGISCIIDEKGRIIKELPLFKRGIIEHNVYLFKRKTFFVKYGNFFFWIYFLGFFVLLFISKRKKM